MNIMNSVGAAAFALASLSPLEKNDDAPIRITRADVEWSNQKVVSAYGALVEMWTNDFNRIGEHFYAPRIARYEGNVRTRCGIMPANNAQYCEATNTVYYDEVFVAAMAKFAGANLHTDGDMTGIGIIAHEMGHAVAMQLGHRSRRSYENESTADCLAGAFANQAQKDRTLEEGDIDEAIFGMAMAGDPQPRLTGDDRFDTIIQARLSRQAHGTKEQRVRNFRAGLSGGPGACLEEFKSSS